MEYIKKIYALEKCRHRIRRGDRRWRQKNNNQKEEKK